MAAQLSPTTILTEDWYAGYVPADENFVIDADPELRAERAALVSSYRFAGFTQDEIEELLVDAGLDFTEVVQDELHRATDEMKWLHRDEDDSTILMRWNQPDDVLDELERIEQDDQREVWVERMTAFRETQLRRLLRDYFQSDRYMDREIVLKWEQKDGKWKPAEKMIVREWVRKLVEEKGSQLSGYASAAGFLRSRITRKRISQDKTGQSGSFARTYNAV